MDVVAKHLQHGFEYELMMFDRDEFAGHDL